MGQWRQRFKRRWRVAVVHAPVVIAAVSACTPAARAAASAGSSSSSGLAVFAGGAVASVAGVRLNREIRPREGHRRRDCETTRWVPKLSGWPRPAWRSGGCSAARGPVASEEELATEALGRRCC